MLIWHVWCLVMLYDSIRSFMKNDRHRKIGGDVDRQLERQRWGPAGHAGSPRQARCTRSGDVVRGLPSTLYQTFQRSCRKGLSNVTDIRLPFFQAKLA